MTNVAHHGERVLLYYAQAQAEYQRTTDRPLRPSTRRSGLARIRDQFYVILAHSAGMLAAFRIQEDGSLKREDLGGAHWAGLLAVGVRQSLQAGRNYSGSLAARG